MKKLYEILDKNYNDYNLGFEVQSPEKEFVSWDSTYAEILALPCVEPNNTLDMGLELSNHYAFKYPVRVGNLLFKNWGFYYIPHHRKDIAVQSYSFVVFNPYTIDLEEVLTIKNTLHRHLKERKNHIPYYDIGFDFDTNNHINFHLYFWKDTQQLHFEVINQRKYPHLLLNEEYESKMQISDFVLFEEEISLTRNYKEYQSMKRRPPILTERFGKKPVLWVDKTNGILGIANEISAQFVPLDQIERFEMTRALPAKGYGWDDFCILEKGKEYTTRLFILPCYAFDKNHLKEKIEKVIGQKLPIVDYGYDC